jgi:hypothetical protein
MILPTLLFKDGSKVNGIHRMLWLPTKTFTPHREFSYFKLPKFFSACFYYLCEVLTFGLLCPVVMAAILSALIMECAVQAYFIRRFFVLCVRNCPSQIDLENSHTEQVGESTRQIVSEIQYVGVHDILKLNKPIEKSNFYEDALELSIIQKAVGDECSDRTFKFFRPALFVVVASGLFLGCVCWDMAAVEPLDWPKFVWMPLLASLLPLSLFPLLSASVHDRVYRTFTTVFGMHRDEVDKVTENNTVLNTLFVGETDAAEVELSVVYKNESNEIVQPQPTPQESVESMSPSETATATKASEEDA